MSETDVVSFQHVNKVYQHPVTGKDTYAIKDVSFRVQDVPGKGEFVCMLGPSGCGKSTILKIIAGLPPSHPHSSGTVVVKGQSVSGPGPDRGMVFQSYSSFPCYKVLDNVAFGLMLQGVPREQREEEAFTWIRRVRLAGSEYKYPHELSGGMQQRVAIARTLAVKPRIILMDEPFGALDRVTRWEMQDLLVELWREVQATVFLVTHDIAEAVYLGDRIYIVSDAPGTIREEIRVPHATAPAAEAQRTTEFARMVNEVSLRVEKRKEPGTAPAAVAPAEAAGARSSG